MKINVSLNSKSINEAIKRLKSIRKMFPEMMQEFLLEVAHWITDKANTYIELSDIGASVKSHIRSSWEYQQTQNGIKVLNTANTEKTVDGRKQTVPTAILVEVGVGIVGQGSPHPNASQNGYEYNIDNGKKEEDGSWHFFSDEADLDIPKSAIDWGMNGKGKSNRMSIYTRGTKGVWYAYNAIVDANTEIAKPNGGEIGEIWDKIKKRYIK